MKAMARPEIDVFVALLGVLAAGGCGDGRSSPDDTVDAADAQQGEDAGDADVPEAAAGCYFDFDCEAEEVCVEDTCRVAGRGGYCPATFSRPARYRRLEMDGLTSFEGYWSGDDISFAWCGPRCFVACSSTREEDHTTAVVRRRRGGIPIDQVYLLPRIDDETADKCLAAVEEPAGGVLLAALGRMTDRLRIFRLSAARVEEAGEFSAADFGMSHSWSSRFAARFVRDGVGGTHLFTVAKDTNHWAHFIRSGTGAFVPVGSLIWEYSVWDGRRVGDGIAWPDGTPEAVAGTRWCDGSNPSRDTCRDLGEGRNPQLWLCDDFTPAIAWHVDPPWPGYGVPYPDPPYPSDLLIVHLDPVAVERARETIPAPMGVGYPGGSQRLHHLLACGDGETVFFYDPGDGPGRSALWPIVREQDGAREEHDLTEVLATGGQLQPQVLEATYQPCGGLRLLILEWNQDPNRWTHNTALVYVEW